jgi:hypothetical protein
MFAYSVSPAEFEVLRAVWQNKMDSFQKTIWPTKVKFASNWQTRIQYCLEDEVALCSIPLFLLFIMCFIYLILKNVASK